jgi:hypothetical protein
MDRGLRRRMLDTVAEMNHAEHRRAGDPETLTRIAQYELAYRMQMSVPEVMDISKEPQHILDLYGARPGFVSAAESADDPRALYKGDDPTFANNCLLAAACWKAACASCSCTTGAGTTTAPRPARA